jgi:hypothetical protein
MVQMVVPDRTALTALTAGMAAMAVSAATEEQEAMGSPENRVRHLMF